MTVSLRALIQTIFVLIVLSALAWTILTALADMPGHRALRALRQAQTAAPYDPVPAGTPTLPPDTWQHEKGQP